MVRFGQGNKCDGASLFMGQTRGDPGCYGPLPQTRQINSSMGCIGFVTFLFTLLYFRLLNGSVLFYTVGKFSVLRFCEAPDNYTN